MTIFTAAFTLILVMDPFGNIPLFISILQNVEPRKRKIVIIREMLIALMILSVFLFFGRFILSAMDISSPAVSIAGGVILFLIAIRMIFMQRAMPEATQNNDSPLIVPLAIPLVAGPSAMTMVILLAEQNPDKIGLYFIALLIAWAFTSGILILSERMGRLLGGRGLKALERLMGMILTTIAVQMLLTGIENYIQMING